MPNPSGAVLDTGVPLIGQPFRVVSIAVLPVVTCNCGSGDTLTLIAQVIDGRCYSTPGQCIACGRVFINKGLIVDRSGQIVCDIEMSAPQPRS